MVLARVTQGSMYPFYSIIIEVADELNCALY